MPLISDEYDFSVELPANIAVGGKILKLVKSRTGEDDKQVVFCKLLTEEEYAEELGLEDED
jgi:hypothetical protein